MFQKSVSERQCDQCVNAGCFVVVIGTSGTGAICSRTRQRTLTLKTGLTAVFTLPGIQSYCKFIEQLGADPWCPRISKMRSSCFVTMSNHNSHLHTDTHRYITHVELWGGIIWKWNWEKGSSLANGLRFDGMRVRVWGVVVKNFLRNARGVLLDNRVSFNDDASWGRAGFSLLPLENYDAQHYTFIPLSLRRLDRIF